jgi:hypothetical protein
VNNLYAVAFADGGLLPVSAADDPLVEFDGEALWRKRKLSDEFGHRDWGGHVARFAVYLDQQGCQSSFQQASGLMYDTA